MERYWKETKRRMVARAERATTRAWGRPVAVLASLLVAGQLAGATHLLLVQHAVCPLDGELVHPEAAAGHGHVQAHARNERLPGIAAADAPEVHHGHEHCVLSSQRRDRAVLHGVVAPHTPPRAILATLPPDGAPTAGRFALHRLAPKQSPPA